MEDLISRQDAIKTSLEFFVEFLGGAFHENAQKELMARFQRLPSADRQRWIPCSERLPEPNRHDALNVDVYYLAQTEFGDMIVASYNESHEGTKWWEQMYSYRIFDDEIVAWMPLPEQYREDGEEE